MKEKNKEVARPIYDRVIIKELGDMPTASALVAKWEPAKESSNTNYKVGEVIAVGKKCEEVQVGEIVSYNKFRTLDILIDNQALVQIRESDIMYVYENFDYSKIANKDTIFQAAKKTTTLGV